MTRDVKLESANVLFLTPDIGGGGAEAEFCRIAPKILRKANRRIFATLRGSLPSLGWPDLDLRVIGWRGSWSYPPAISKTRRLINGNHIDLVYSLSRCANFVAYYAAQLSSRRPILVMGVNSQPWRAYALFPSIGGRFWMAMKRRVYPGADLVLCNSQSARTELIERFGCRPASVSVVRNPICVSELQELAQTPASADARELPPFLLYAGRFCEGKGLDELITVFARICRDIPHRLVLVGDGPLKRRLAEQAGALQLGGRVIFTGWRQNPFPFYRLATAYVTASYWEGLPYGVLEAMALGLPVVSARSTSWIDEYHARGACLAFAPGDVAALAAAMKQVAVSPETRQSLAAAGHLIMRDYDVEQVVAERDRPLVSVLEASRSGDTV